MESTQTQWDGKHELLTVKMKTRSADRKSSHNFQITTKTIARGKDLYLKIYPALVTNPTSDTRAPETPNPQLGAPSRMKP